MLVLSRKRGEALVAQLPSGETIEVVVCRIDGDKVRLGITAPPAVKVLRTELLGTEPKGKAREPFL